MPNMNVVARRPKHHPRCRVTVRKVTWREYEDQDHAALQHVLDFCLPMPCTDDFVLALAECLPMPESYDIMKECLALLMTMP